MEKWEARNSKSENGIPSALRYEVAKREQYPTPTAENAAPGLSQSQFARNFMNLCQTVQLKDMFPTPTCQENEHPEAEVNDKGRRVANNGGCTHGLNLADTVRMFPTPTASDVEGGTVKNVEFHEGSFSRKNKAGIRWGVKLRDAIHHLENKKLYPTPTCQECEHPDATLTDTGRRLSKDGSSSHSLNLSDTVKKYPTPAARDYKGARLPDTIARTGRNPETNSLPDCVENKAESTAVLNPDWVEWLMGWPIGWAGLKPLSREGFNQWKESVIDGSFWREDIADISDIDRVTTKKTDRVARLKAIGNGQVAICATVAWPLLKTSE